MRALPGGLKGEAAQLRAISDILASNHAGNMAILFGRVTDTFANLAPFVANFTTEQTRRTTRDWLKLEKTFHERAFASAVRTQKANGARKHAQSHIIERVLTTVPLRQIGGLDNRS